jgi:hypothetical protein
VHLTSDESIAGTPRAVVRSLAQTGIGVGQVFNKSSVGEQVPTSKFGPLGEPLLGKEPLQGLADTALGYEKTLKAAGIPLATPLAVGATAALSVADYMGLGFGKRVAEIAAGGLKAGDVVSKLAETTPLEASRVLPESVPLGDRLMISGNLNHEGRRQFMKDNPSLGYDKGRFKKVQLPVKEEPNVKLPVQDLSGGEVSIKKTKATQTLSQQSVQKPAKTAAPQQSVNVDSSIKSPISSAARSKEVSIPASSQKTTRLSTVGNASSKVGKSIETGAIEKKLTDGFGGTAGYDPIVVKEQAQNVSDLVNSDLNSARAMVRGEIPLPENIRGAALITGMEDYAVKNGDSEMLRELAQSPLASETSRSAQELRLLAERNPDSPVTAMQDIAKTREAMVSKRYGNLAKAKDTISSQIKKEIAASRTKETWASFIESIQC